MTTATLPVSGLTSAQQKRRSDRIGASDVPIIVMGPHYPHIERYNLYSLWAEKTGRRRADADNWAMRAGRYAEPGILRYASEFLGPVTRRNIDKVHSNGVMVAHLDARLKDTRWLLECKAPGLTNRWYPTERWGEPGEAVFASGECSYKVGKDQWGQPEYSDGVLPAEYYWQVQAQIACTDSSNRRNAQKRGIAWSDTMLIAGVYLCVQLPGMMPPLRHYKIHRNDEDIAHLEHRVCEFNDQHLYADVAPPAVPTESDFKLQIRDRHEWVSVDDRLFQQVCVLEQRKKSLAPAKSEALKEVEKQLAEAQRALVAAADGSTHITCEAGHKLVLKTSHVSYDRTSKSFTWS